VPGNLARAETYRDEAERADAVVHTAFEYSADGAERVDLDMQATRTLMRARRLIYTSNAYRPRIAVERILGPSAAAIRVGMVYGGLRRRNDREPVRGGAADNAHLPYLRDAAHNRWSLIYLDDLAALYAAVVETEAAGVFNGVDGQPLSVLRTRSSAPRPLSELSHCQQMTPSSTSVHEQHTVDVMKRTVALDCKDARELDWSPRYRSFEDRRATAYAECVRNDHATFHPRCSCGSCRSDGALRPGAGSAPARRCGALPASDRATGGVGADESATALSACGSARDVRTARRRRSLTCAGLPTTATTTRSGSAPASLHCQQARKASALRAATTRNGQPSGRIARLIRADIELNGEGIDAFDGGWIAGSMTTGHLHRIAAVRRDQRAVA
jgi:hypothetical protein